MAAATFYLPFRPAFDANGIIVPGAQLFFYASGTTTPLSVYSDAALTTELGNPVEANSAGAWPTIYLDASLTYRVVLKTSLGVTLDDQDPYIPGFAAELSGGLLDHEGFVLVSAFGAVGTETEDHSTNHQTAIAAALAYAVSIGASGVQLGSGHYSIWTPQRTPTAAITDLHTDVTGIPFVIPAGVHIEFRAGAGGTWYHRRTRTGADPAIFAGTQLLTGGEYWRGGMFLQRGTVADAATYEDRGSFTLRGTWRIYGGLPRSGNPGSHALDVNGAGWDESDKPIWHENDYYTGDTFFDGHIVVDGFRGELIYQGGGNTGRIFQKGFIQLSNTDGDNLCITPNGDYPSATPDYPGGIFAEHIRLYKGYQALESRLAAGHIAFLDIEDCVAANGIAGGAGFGADVETTPGRTPTTTIKHFRVTRSGRLSIGSWLDIGTLELNDSYATLGTGGVQDAVGTTIGLVIARADRAPPTTPFGFDGKVGTAGAKGTYNNYVGQLHLTRTAYAETNAIQFTYAFKWDGSLGDRNIIGLVTGETFALPAFGLATFSAPNFAPGVLEYRQNQSYGSAPAQNVETTPTLVYLGPVISMTATTGASSFPVTLASPATKAPVGARVILQNNSSGLLVIKTANTLMQQPIVMKAGSRATFEVDPGGSWKLIVGGDEIVVAVAGLPAAADVGAGYRAFVTDATATTFASVVAGGGANAVPVVSTGASWIIG